MIDGITIAAIARLSRLIILVIWQSSIGHCGAYFAAIRPQQSVVAGEMNLLANDGALPPMLPIGTRRSREVNICYKASAGQFLCCCPNSGWL